MSNEEIFLEKKKGKGNCSHIFELGGNANKIYNNKADTNYNDLTIKRSKFLKPTLYFLIAGFFMPSFTAVGLLEIQKLLTKSGIECADAWTIISRFATFGAIILPIIFLYYVAGTSTIKSQSIIVKLIVFNLLEYTFIQACLIPCFTTGHTLCYITDGQNGIALIFTALLSLPVLVLLSVLFDIIDRATKKFKT